MSATAPTAEQGELASPRRLVDVVLRARTFGIIVVLGVVVLVIGADPVALRRRRRDPVSSSARRRVIALVAVGETMVDPDPQRRPVGRLGASGSRPTSRRTCSATHPGISIVVVFLVGLGVGLACGVVTGAITAIGRVPSLVVTLAMLYIIRGVDTIIVGSGVVLASTEPTSFLNIPTDTVLGIPDVALAVAVVVGIAAYYLQHLPLRP